MALTHLLIVLLVATAASAQTYYCPTFGGISQTWNPDTSPTITVQTAISISGTYGPDMNCYIAIQATISGRIVISVAHSDLAGYTASIGVRTTALSGYLADWSQLTYNLDRHQNFISIENRIYISFQSYKSPSIPSRGVTLSLTFLRPFACLPNWTPISLSGRSSCVGVSLEKMFKFGEAQRYCNLWRANLLVAERDNVSSVLKTLGPNAANTWIGMTAEPQSSYSYYRWISNVPVDSRQLVSCTGGCRPGSKDHRCVQALTQTMLAQVDCGIALRPICYMPTGGTDTFYAGSAGARGSGALLAGAVLAFWSLLR